MVLRRPWLKKNLASQLWERLPAAIIGAGSPSHRSFIVLIFILNKPGSRSISVPIISIQQTEIPKYFGRERKNSVAKYVKCYPIIYANNLPRASPDLIFIRPIPGAGKY